MLPQQVDDFIQLLVVAVAVHKNFKLRIASFGFSGLYVDKIYVVFLQEKANEQVKEIIITQMNPLENGNREQFDEHTWKSLSAFTSPPISFLREKMIVALPFSDVFFFSVFSSIFVKVDLFI